MNARDIGERLFFIVGCGRSGTTLLKSMLDAHPQVRLPPETFFWSSIRRRFPGGEDVPMGERIRYVASRWWVRDAGVTAEALHRHLEEWEEPGWNELFLATLAAMLGDAEAAAVGEKTPAHVTHAPQLLEEFPHARVIQIARDPRAVLASYRGAKVGTNQAVAVIREWGAAQAVHARLEGQRRYLQIRYEDLVADPGPSLESVCALLSLPYAEAMLDFHRRDDPGFSREQDHHANTMKPVFRSSLDAWKSKLPPMQTAMIEHSLGREMEALGYRRSDRLPRVSPWNYRLSRWSEVLHFHVVRRPRELLRRLRALRRIRRLGPSQGGRAR